MIGKILYHAPGEKRPPKATILFELDDEAAFSYNPSLYGYCTAKTAAELEGFQPATWVQPLEAAFTPDYLARALAEPERKIAKQMNMFRVAYKPHGVGNGYWQEILYRCGVHPQRKAVAITPAEIDCLHAATRQVMQSAVAQGGSAEEKDFFGSPGGYVRSMGGRLKGQPCPRCGTAIQGKSILGANVYFCPVCQK
jgi:formamidopyrimidine-DNA glycosylase